MAERAGERRAMVRNERASDYPPPSYAGYIWWAQRKIYLARPGREIQVFEDTGEGLAALRIALLAFADRECIVGSALGEPSISLDVRGQRKVIEDIWQQD